MKNKDVDKLITIILTSAVSGAIIGLLMSPKKELSKREKIAKEGDRYLKDINNMIKEIRQFLDSKSKEAKADYQATKDDIDELGEDARGKGQDLLRRAKRLLSYNA